MSRMKDDAGDLAAWTREWQAAEPAPAPMSSTTTSSATWKRLRRQVESRGRLLRWVLAGEVMAVLAGSGAVFALAFRFGRPLDLAFAGSLSAFFVGLLAYALWNRRGLWSAAAESTAAFLDLALRRNERRQRTLRWLVWMVVGELVLLVTWLLSLPGARDRGLLEHGRLLGLAAAVLALVAAWVVMAKRYSRRERERLLALRSELEEEENGLEEAGDGPSRPGASLLR